MNGVYRPIPRDASPASLDFRRRYEPDWIELEALVDRALRRGLGRLEASEVQASIRLYRRVMGSLALAREIVLDAALIEYLEALAARAYLALHGSTRPRTQSWLALWLREIPRSVRRVRGELVMAAALFGLGIALGWVLTIVEPAWFWAFVDDTLAAGRSPAERTATLEAMLYTHSTDGGVLTQFAGRLFVHNVEIGFLAFALGFVAGLPTACLMFGNGLTLGAFAALYAERGLGLAFAGWLLPHGVPELTAALLCGAAGLSLGRAVVFPGIRGVGQALQQAGRNAAAVVAGAILLLLVAALFEGIVRQVVLHDGVRLTIASVEIALVVAWLVLGGRRRREGDER
ncbi:MAG TPA: stage II sporulation protein M [Nannocystaceae bacterium]|nr:stage II sporulation protein M [Nannocystaceae bacterium]